MTVRMMREPGLASETALPALSRPASPAELAGRKTAPSLGAFSFPLSKRGVAEAPMGSADTELGIPKLQKLGRSLRGDLKRGRRAVAWRRSDTVLCLGAMSGVVKAAGWPWACYWRLLVLDRPGRQRQSGSPTPCQPLPVPSLYWNLFCPPHLRRGSALPRQTVGLLTSPRSSL